MKLKGFLSLMVMVLALVTMMYSDASALAFGSACRGSADDPDPAHFTNQLTLTPGTPFYCWVWSENNTAEDTPWPVLCVETNNSTTCKVEESWAGTANPPKYARVGWYMGNMPSGVVKIRIYPQQAPTEQAIIKLAVPQINITSANCPASVNLEETVQCSITAEAVSPPPMPFIYSWSATNETVIESGANSSMATIKAYCPGPTQVKARVFYHEAIPEDGAERTFTINVPEPNLGNIISCDKSYANQETAKCKIAGLPEGYAFQWNQEIIKTNEDGSVMLKLPEDNTVSANITTENCSIWSKTVSATVEKLNTKMSPPRVSIKAEAGSVIKTIPITFTGTVTVPEGVDYEYKWYINDVEQEEQSLSLTTTFPEIGTNIVKLVVWATGSENIRAEKSLKVYVDEFPRISIYPNVQPRSASVGETVTISTTLPKRLEGLPIKVIWTLPDGSTAEGLTASYVLRESDIEPDKIKSLVATYRAYYEGFPDSEVTGLVKFSGLPPYRMPQFGVKLYTPVEGPAPHYIFAAPKQLDAGVPGYRYNLTYLWEVPEINMTSDKKFFTNEITEPGIYTLKLKVADDRGTVSENQTAVTVTDPIPVDVNFKTYMSNKYSVAPLTVYVRGEIVGGHPRYKPRIAGWKVNGEQVNSISSLNYKFENPGTYTIGAILENKDKTTLEKSFQLEVKANQPPTCTISNNVSSLMKTVQFTVNCEDSDGKIKKYLWVVNNGPEFLGSNKYLYKAPSGSTVSANVKIVDDGDNEVTLSDSVKVPW